MVNVALSDIKKYLRFTATFLIWVVNAYLVVVGSLLLLENRISVVFGMEEIISLISRRNSQRTESLAFFVKVESILPTIKHNEIL